MQTREHSVPEKRQGHFSLQPPEQELTTSISFFVPAEAQSAVAMVHAILATQRVSSSKPEISVVLYEATARLENIIVGLLTETKLQACAGHHKQSD
jgi:hypothetical protein